MDTWHLAGHRRHVSILETTLEQAVHRCIDLASPFGTIELLSPASDGTREFNLDVGDRRSQRLRWSFRAVTGGTELRVTPQSSFGWLARLDRASHIQQRDLHRRLALLPHLLNLRIVVLGGGTGLYSVLCGLRDRTASLAAIVSGRPQVVRKRSPKDELGWLPGDDASIGLVAMAPTVRESLSLRTLLAHPMGNGEGHCAPFGMVLVEALTEISGSRQAALDEAVLLMGIRGRVVLATASDDWETPAAATLELIRSADLFVLAPGHPDVDALPILGCDGIVETIRESRALKVVVTNIMSAEDGNDDATTSGLVRRLSREDPAVFDVVLANAAAFSNRQVDAYAARGSRPIVPDIEETRRYAGIVVTRPLVASGSLARHDPELLGDSLMGIVTASLVGGTRSADERVSANAQPTAAVALGYKLS